MKSLCVYCGSSSGFNPIHRLAAQAMAAAVVESDLRLVYGGGSVGLMGAIADEVLRLGGEAIGVIPDALMRREVDHKGLTQLHVVRDMHERKALMAELSDGFVAMPGGIGTLEETFEAATWSQLGLHDKPIGILNVDGFYQGLLGFLEHVVSQGFLKTEHAALFLHDDHPQRLITRMKAWRPVPEGKWLDQDSANRTLP